ncbi:flagellar motor protein MotA [Niveispirillum lacus]|uniref:Flagellar motor protein MotA n=1 Tax=Niveispirillum lacus TaxID=1981099 RepID=A0A255YWB3_9PROT|nr:MotA/TolQ/ExbB proton channel family protein [Niveispirillum lacus]OYQ33471.1 flagellar motor protein MotA [Niveispirillum lacus]
MSDRATSRNRPPAPPPPAAPAAAAATPPAKAPPLPRMRRRLDLATIFGLSSGLLLVLGALVMGGGGIGSFIDIPSVLIVLGGTAAITTISFSGSDMRAALKALSATMVANTPDPRAAAQTALSLAEFARRSGPLALQPLATSTRPWPVLSKAVELIADGLPADDAERILRTEIEANLSRARTASAVMRRAAEVAPAMGLIGTLVGLVQMLGNLSDPSTVGPAMAVALITTFYGAILGSMVFSPIAAKIDRNAEREALVDGLYLLAAGSVARQENPRRLEVMINTVLPPEMRVSAYEQ